MVVHRATGEIRLVDLVIAPSHRSCGVGTNLLKTLIKESKATRSPLRLNVLRGSRAFAWYQRLGFGVIKDSEIYVEMERPASATTNA